jgi:hypothetical protein
MRCICTYPFQVNSTGSKDTAGLIVRDLHCDGCGWPLADDDRRIPLIQRVGLNVFSVCVVTSCGLGKAAAWRVVERLAGMEPGPFEHLQRQQYWLSGYGMLVSLASVALALAGAWDIGPPELRAFLIGAGLGSVIVLIALTVRQNRRLRRFL